MSSGRTSGASVSYDAARVSLPERRDVSLQAPLCRGELEDSSNRSGSAQGLLPLHFPWLSPTAQGVPVSLGNRLGPSQDRELGISEQSSFISQAHERYREYSHVSQRLPTEEDVLINPIEQVPEGLSSTGSSSLFTQDLDESLVQVPTRPPPGFHPGFRQGGHNYSSLSVGLHQGGQAGGQNFNGNNVSLSYPNQINRVNLLIHNVLMMANTLIDYSQIGPIECMYRELDDAISFLTQTPGLDPSFVQREVTKIRGVLTDVEKRLATYYYSVDPMTKLSIKFSISKLRDPNHLAILAGVTPIPNLFPSHQSRSQLVSPPSPILAPRQSSSPVQRRESKQKPTPQGHEIDETVLSNDSLDRNSLYNPQDANLSAMSTKARATQVSKFRVFVRRKEDLEFDLEALESKSSCSSVQPDNLKAQASDLKARLTNLRIFEWVNADFSHCPNIERILDPENICDWEDKVARRISNLIYLAEEKISIRKGFSQTGFAKRELPKFNGSVLDYPLFKKNWSIEITPNCLPQMVELNTLKGVLPLSAKDMLYEVDSLQEAWAILDKIYGQSFDLRNKLKQEFLGITISAKQSPYKEIEIFEKVHKISAKIRAAEAQGLLECDFEYISIVYRMLPEVQKEKWISIAPSNPKWDSFYRFLEEVYQRAILKT